MASIVAVSPSSQRIQAILNHLEITFTNCIFIYSEFDVGAPLSSVGVQGARARRPSGKPAHEEGLTPPPAHALSRRRSTLASIHKWVAEHHNPLECIMSKGASASAARNAAFVGCVFPPGTGGEKEVRTHVGAYETENVRFTFVSCVFMRRELSLLEALIRWFKRMLGISFELDFVVGAASVEWQKFKLVDVPWIVGLVTSQIQEERIQAGQCGQSQENWKPAIAAGGNQGQGYGQLQLPQIHVHAPRRASFRSNS